jgi:hypothetical protein
LFVISVRCRRQDRADVIAAGGVIANIIAAALPPLNVEPGDLPLSPPLLWQLIAASTGGVKTAMCS